MFRHAPLCQMACIVPQGGSTIRLVFFYIVQVTYSEKGTKLTSQLRISKFRLLIFFNKSIKIEYFKAFSISEKCIMSYQRQKETVCMIFIGFLKFGGAYVIACKTVKNSVKVISQITA